MSTEKTKYWHDFYHGTRVVNMDEVSKPPESEQDARPKRPGGYSPPYDRKDTRTQEERLQSLFNPYGGVPGRTALAIVNVSA